MLKLALTKGRLEERTVELLERSGAEVTAFREKGRKLIIGIPEPPLEAVFAKAWDVVTFVEHGACDVGVVGKDTLSEMNRPVYEILDLKFGKCRFALAAKEGEDFFDGYRKKTVATKYPNVARKFFARKNMDVEIIRLEGSVELAPLLGLADGIVDIVETGTTLRENGLKVVETVSEVSARLIANNASMKLKKREIMALCERFAAAAQRDPG